MVFAWRTPATQTSLVGELALPRSDAQVRRAGAWACAVTCSLLLIPAGLLLVALAMVSSIPDSDTGERGSTAAATLLSIGGATLMLTCVPVTYLCVRDRLRIGFLVTAVCLVGSIAIVYVSLR